MIERLVYFSRLPKALLNPPKLVQISEAKPSEPVSKAD